MKIFGYPMDLVENCLFVDRATGESVNKYRFKGELYLATSRWGFDKVKCSNQGEDE